MSQAIKSLNQNRALLKKSRFQRWSSPKKASYGKIKSRLGNSPKLTELEKAKIRKSIRRDRFITQIKIILGTIATLAFLFLLFKWLVSLGTQT